jgi:hypothetical protein
MKSGSQGYIHANGGMHSGVPPWVPLRCIQATNARESPNRGVVVGWMSEALSTK